MWREYFCATNIEEVLDILAERKESARIIAGGTDLLLEIERKIRKDIEILIDISRIPDLDRIVLDEDDVIHLGPLVTHSHCVGSKLITEKALPLAQATLEVGAPQIRNRGTIAGNLITASPANDTITPLIAMKAEVVLRSLAGERVLRLQDLYSGVRMTEMHPDEMLVDIRFPALKENQRGVFIKLGLRRAQAISLVNMTTVLTFEDETEAPIFNRIIRNAAITLGAVAPTIINATEAEEFLVGQVLDEDTIETAAKLAQQSATPIDDVRSSRDYRSEMVRVGVLRTLRTISRGEERDDFSGTPVLLWGNEYGGAAPKLVESSLHTDSTQINTRINGIEYTSNSGLNKSLLRLLREDFGLIGTKEGCAEGECGACTVFLDGVAAMSCLVPAVRAHGADIITIEGIAQNSELHPVQKAFINEGAVQCGYCTPGFIMSGVKLLEENPKPSKHEIKQAITGNLCRCTGYYKIIDAIESASRMEVGDG
jgi:carbon-monoxide dehydrogenase medium subunit